MITYKKIAFSLLNNGLEIGAGMLVLLAITRQYLPAEAGAWMVFNTCIVLGSKMREGITQTALSKAAAQERLCELKANLLATLLIEACFSALALCVGYFLNGTLGDLIIRYPLFAFPWAIYRWAMFVLQARMHPQKQLIPNTLLIALSLTAVTVSDNLPSLLGLLGASLLLTALVGLYLADARQLMSQPCKRQHFADVYFYGKHGLLREAVGTLSARGLLLLAASFLSLSDVAMLGLAQRYAQLLLLPNAAIHGLYIGKVFQLQDKELMAQLMGRVAAGLQLLMGAIAVLMALLSPWALPALHGQEYAGVYALLLPMAIAYTVAAPIGNAFGTLCAALRRPDLGAWLVVQNGLFNLAFSALAIYLWQAQGATLAICISEAFGLLAVIWLLQRHFGIDFFGHISHGWRIHIYRIFSYTRKVTYTWTSR